MLLAGEEDHPVRGNDQVIALLNEALKEELTAINQYFVHAEMNENWGYERLGKHIKKQAIDEMKHAEKLIERILFLEGIPVVSHPPAVKIGATVKAQMENDLAGELGAVVMYNAAVKATVEAGDNGSRQLFEKLLSDEEEHADWLEAQLHQIQELGLDNYLSQQLEE
jgi:bacterioferritin